MNIYEKRVESGYYTGKDIEYPKKPTTICPNGHSFKTVFKNGKFVTPNFCSECGVSLKKYYDEKMKEYEVKRDEYIEKHNKRREDHKNDLKKYLGYEHINVFDEVFEYACENFSLPTEIKNFVDEICEFINKEIKTRM